MTPSSCPARLGAHLHPPKVASASATPQAQTVRTGVLFATGSLFLTPRAGFALAGVTLGDTIPTIENGTANIRVVGSSVALPVDGLLFLAIPSRHAL